MANPQLPSERYYADQIKTRLNRPLGLKQSDNIEPVILMAKALAGTANLKPADIRKVIFACVDIELHPHIVNHFAGTKTPLEEDLKFEDFLREIRIFFSTAKSAPTQFHDIMNFKPSWETSAALNSSLQDFERDFHSLRAAMAKSAAPFELFISKLPDHLRSPASSYIISHADCDYNGLSTFFTSFLAQNSHLAQSSPAPPRPRAPLLVSAPSSPPSTPSSSGTSLEQYCKYCRSNGHLIEDCEKKKKADSRRVPAQTIPQSSGLTSSPPVVLALKVHAPSNVNAQPLRIPNNPDYPVSATVSTTDSPPAPYIGHPVLPVSFRSSIASISSHALPDLGSPNSNLISLDTAKLLGFKPTVLPGSDAPAHTSIGILPLSISIGTLRKSLDFNVVNDIQPPSILSFNAITDLGLNLMPEKRMAQAGYEMLKFIDYRTINPRVYSEEVQPLIVPDRLPHTDDFYDLSDSYDSDY
jgi:hypothetical protein